MRRFIVLIFLLQSSQGIIFATDFHLYFLGGQSNMNGLGYNKSLPDSLNKTFKDVMIFQGNPAKDDSLPDGRGHWAHLQPGQGALFTADEKSNHYSNRFGCELSFAQTLLQSRPDEKIALIKYSKLGASIDSSSAGKFGCWEPFYVGKNGINQFDHFLATVKNAMQVEDIDGDGTKDRLIPAGIIWMQGEGDASIKEEFASRYLQNLQNLISEMRKVFESLELPVVIGLISDSGIAKGTKTWKFGEIVQQAQKDFVANDPNAALMSETLKYDYSEKWHYNSEGYIKMGISFAQEIDRLRNQK